MLCHKLDNRMLYYALDAMFLERVNYFPRAQVQFLGGVCTPLHLTIHGSKGEAELLELIFYALALHKSNENKSGGSG